MSRYMTKKRFLEEVWEARCLPAIKARYEQDGVPDYDARCQNWNDTVDFYVRDGTLPPNAGEWRHPPSNDPRPKRGGR